MAEQDEALTPEQARRDPAVLHALDDLNRLSNPIAERDRVARSRQYGVGGLLPPLTESHPRYVLGDGFDPTGDPMPETEQDRDYVEVYRDSDGDHRWRYKAGNGETMADSGEGYRDVADCLAGLVAVTGRIAAITETKDAPLPGPGTIRVVFRRG